MKQANLLTSQRKLAIDRWLVSNQDQLERYSNKQLNNYGYDGHDSAEFLAKLYDLLLKHAFEHPGWQDDLSILKQSKRRIRGWVQDMHISGRGQVSFEEMTSEEDDGPHGNLLPEGFYTEPNQEHHMWSSSFWQALHEVADTEYKLALVEVMQGEKQITEVANAYGVHKSTVSRNVEALKVDLQKHMIEKGLVY